MQWQCLLSSHSQSVSLIVTDSHSIEPMVATVPAISKSAQTVPQNKGNVSLYLLEGQNGCPYPWLWLRSLMSSDHRSTGDDRTLCAFTPSSGRLSGL